MIKAIHEDESINVSVTRNVAEAIGEFVAITGAVIDILADEYGSDAATKIITLCVKVSLADEEHIESAQNEMIDYINTLSEKG